MYLPGEAVDRLIDHKATGPHLLYGAAGIERGEFGERQIHVRFARN